MALTPEEIQDKITEMRLRLGDTNEYDQYLSDQSYEFFINKYENDGLLFKNIAYAILAKLASGHRQRVLNEEAYQAERFKNYKEWLEMVIANPTLLGNYPAIYVGGVVREDVQRLECDPKYMDSTFYRGQQARTPYQNNKRVAGVRHTKEVEEVNLPLIP